MSGEDRAVRVRMVVKGRLDPTGAALVGLGAEVTPRHHRLVVGAGGLPGLLVALERLERLGVEVDRIAGLPRFAHAPGPARRPPDGCASTVPTGADRPRRRLRP